MPALSLPMWSLIASLASTGAGLGESIYQAHDAGINQRAAQQQLAEQQKAQAAQAALTKQEATLGSQGQAQAQTGGSLTDTGFSSFVNQLAGYPGYQAGSTSPTTSTSTTPSTMSTGGTPDMKQILAMLQSSGQGASITGGSASQTPTPENPNFSLATPVLG